LIFAGGLAVSRIPTYSIKKLSIPQEKQFILFAGVVLFLIVLTVFPWHVLALVDLAYLASLPLSYRAAKRG